MGSKLDGRSWGRVYGNRNIWAPKVPAFHLPFGAAAGASSWAGCLMGGRKGVEAPAGSTLRGVCSLNGGVLSSSSPFKQDPPAGEA